MYGAVLNCREACDIVRYCIVLHGIVEYCIVSGGVLEKGPFSPA